MVSPDGVAPSRMVSVSASVNLPLHHKVQKFSSGTGLPWWSRKKGRKMVVVVVLLILTLCLVHFCDGSLTTINYSNTLKFCSTTTLLLLLLLHYCCWYYYKERRLINLEVMFKHGESNVDSDQDTSSSDTGTTVNQDWTSTTTNGLQQSTILSA